jgi:hypothetical protein
MVMFAVTGGLGVMVRDVGTMLAVGCGGCGQLHPGALPPGRCAGDKRKRDGQDKNVANNTTHPVMLAGQAESRQLTGYLQNVLDLFFLM